MSLIHDLFDLKGQVALVTGGSSGIGRAIANYLAQAGAAVVHAALPHEEEGLKAAVTDVESVGSRAAYVTCDVSQLDALPDMAERATACFGPPDILVNAAGVNFRESWDKVTPESWNKTITINLTGAVLSGTASGAIHARERMGEDHQYCIAAVAARISQQHALRCFEGWGDAAHACHGGSVVQGPEWHHLQCYRAGFFQDRPHLSPVQ